MLFHSTCWIKVAVVMYTFISTSNCHSNTNQPEIITFDPVDQTIHPTDANEVPNAGVGGTLLDTISTSSPITVPVSGTLVVPVPAYADCQAPTRAAAVQCGPSGFPICQNGECILIQHLLFGYTILGHKCKCDAGWTGNNCDLCCDLQCSQGSHCVIVEMGTAMKCSEPLTTTTVAMMEPDPEPAILGTHLQLNTALATSTDCLAESRNIRTICEAKHYCYNGNCSVSDQGITLPSILPPFSTLSSCVCDPGWYGPECNLCCDLECNNGTCYVDGTATMNCSCFPGYIGTHCEYLAPTTTPVIIDRTPTWYWYVIGVGIGAVVLLFITMVLLPYYLWRKRNIFIMKIIKYFQTPENPNDGKLYDAYVSYSEQSVNDERFAIQMIYPILEKKLGFKLFIPSKDTIPGHCRQETIDDGIEHSRRTILLISPGYLVDGWPRQELLTAQWEMLAQRHCIIPIILKDISDVKFVDPVLTNIMKAVKCLNWPADGDIKKEETFWKRLELLMPKVNQPQSNTPGDDRCLPQEKRNKDTAYNDNICVKLLKYINIRKLGIHRTGKFEIRTEKENICV